MAQFSFFRFWSLARTSLRDDFCENKKWYVLCIVLVIAGVVCGLIAGIRIAPDVSVERIPDTFLRRFIDGDISVLGLFFARVLVDLFLLLIIYVSNCRPAFCFVSLLLLIYRAFCLGVTSTILIAIFKFGGVLNVLLVILPTQIMLLTALTVFIVMCVSYNWGCKVYGGSIFCADFWTQSRLAIYFIIVLLIGAIVLEMLTLTWLRAFLIIS